MKKLFLFIITICVWLVVSGQHVNPFDIPGVPTDTVEITTELLLSAQEESRPDRSLSNEDNPFEKPKASHQGESASIPLQNSSRTPVSDDRTNIIVLVYVLVMSIILTLAVSMNRKRFRSMLLASINSNHLRTLYRDTKVWTNGQSVLLYVFFFLNMSFLLWIWSIKSAWLPDANLFLIGFILLIIYVGRHMIMWLLASIYSLGQEVDLHNYSIALHNKILGILVLPFILALEFLPEQFTQILTGILFVLIGLIYMLRQGKSLLLGLGMRGLNPFYFFIYLCAVEIAPILVFYKLLMGAL